MEQRDHREGQLQAEDHLAEDQELLGRLLAHEPDHQHRGNQGDQARDQPAQPGRDLQVQEAFHDDLTGERPGQCRALPGAEQRDAEEDRRGLAQERREQLVRLLDGRHLRTIAVEHRGAQDQDRRVDEEGDVEGHRRIDQIVLARGRPAGVVRADPPGLHQRGVEEEIVGHHRRPEDADRHEQ